MKRNANLQRDVLDELAWDPSIDAAQIGVTAREGIVSLTGHVPTLSEKHAAEKAAKHVHGVKGIANEIEVRPADSHQRDDEHIAAAAVHALEWNSKVPSDCLQVTVQDGWITLEGTLAHKFEKAAAVRTVRQLTGARGVTDNIVVAAGATQLARRTADQIKAEIEAALRRSAVVDSRRIDLEVNEDAVVLTGDVHSHAEHDEVERIVWTCCEVSRVDNCVTITPWGQGPMEEWGY